MWTNIFIKIHNFYCFYIRMFFFCKLFSHPPQTYVDFEGFGAYESAVSRQSHAVFFTCLCTHSRHGVATSRMKLNSLMQTRISYFSLDLTIKMVLRRQLSFALSLRFLITFKKSSLSLRWIARMVKKGAHKSSHSRLMWNEIEKMRQSQSASKKGFFSLFIHFIGAQKLPHGNSMNSSEMETQTVSSHHREKRTREASHHPVPRTRHIIVEKQMNAILWHRKRSNINFLSFLAFEQESERERNRWVILNS